MSLSLQSHSAPSRLKHCDQLLKWAFGRLDIRVPIASHSARILQRSNGPEFVRPLFTGLVPSLFRKTQKSGRAHPALDRPSLSEGLFWWGLDAVRADGVGMKFHSRCSANPH